MIDMLTLIRLQMASGDKSNYLVPISHYRLEYQYIMLSVGKEIILLDVIHAG